MREQRREEGRGGWRARTAAALCAFLCAFFSAQLLVLDEAEAEVLLEHRAGHSSVVLRLVRGGRVVLGRRVALVLDHLLPLLGRGPLAHALVAVHAARAQEERAEDLDRGH